MKRRMFLIAFVALVLGLAPTAYAHTWWDVDNTCDVEGGPFFYPGGPSQWWKIHANASGAFNGCHLYTSNAQTATYNYADWYLPLRSCEWAMPSLGGHNDGRCADEKKYTGTYQVFAWLVREGHFTTRRVPYLRYAFGLSHGVTSRHVIDQAVAPTGNRIIVNGWLDTRVDSGYAGFMRIIDHTGETSQTKWVGVDRMYFHPVH